MSLDVLRQVIGSDKPFETFCKRENRKEEIYAFMSLYAIGVNGKRRATLSGVK